MCVCSLLCVTDAVTGYPECSNEGLKGSSIPLNWSYNSEREGEGDGGDKRLRERMEARLKRDQQEKR